MEAHMEKLANKQSENDVQSLNEEELDQAAGGYAKPGTKINGDDDFIDGKSQSKTGKQKYYG